MQGPTPLTAAQVQIAVKPALGGEMKVYVTQDQALELMQINILAANSGVNDYGSPYPFNNTALAAKVYGYAMDLIVVAENVISDSAPIIITIAGLDQNGAAQTGIAVLETPAFATVTDQIFETGWSADVIPTVATNQWTAVLSVSISCTSAAAYGKFSVWAMPNQSRYTLVGNTQEKSIRTRSPEPLAISAGLDEGAYVKPGPKPIGTMNVRQRWVSFGDGLARFDGANVTVRVDVVKEQKVVDQKIYALGGTLNVVPSAGELAAVGEFAATILYTDLAIMCATQTGVQPAP